MIFEFSKYKLDVDADKTRAFYQRKYTPAECSCAGCRNFREAVGILPREVKSFFDNLGIDMKKMREVYTFNANDDNTVSYGGFTHICGKILAADSEWIAITPDFKISFQEDCDLPEDVFPLPAVQLEIWADIPWVLEGKMRI